MRQAERAISPSLCCGQEFLVDARFVVEPLLEAGGDQPGKVFVPLQVLAEEDQVEIGDRLVAVAGFFGKARAGRHIHLGADDRLDPGISAFFIEFDGAEHIAVVGNGHRRHPVLPGLGEQVAEADGAVQKRILGMKMEMYKVRLVHGFLKR